MQFAPLYPIIYSILQPMFPSCLWSGGENYPEVALTFDDRPHGRWTPQLLDVLDRAWNSREFFLAGQLRPPLVECSQGCL